MFYVKSVLDPINSISQLDVITVISNTQFKKLEFYDEAKKQDNYDKLDEE
jgi:hypothetical protein